MILHFMIKSMSKPRLLTGSDILKKTEITEKPKKENTLEKKKG